MERISSHQFMVLGAAVLMGTTFLPVASMVTEIGGRDSWMSVLPALAVGIPYGLMIIALMEQFPGRNLLQVSESLFGKWIGKMIGILYILITGYFGGLLLGQLGDIYQSSIMPISPLGVFYLGGLLLVFFLVHSGIEVFAHFSELVFPIIIIALVLNIVFSIPRIEQGELMPILSEGIKPVFMAGFKAVPFVMEYGLFLAGLLTFLPINKQELPQIRKGVWKAVFLVGLLNTFVVLIQIVVFGPAETVSLVYGLLVLGKMVEISQTVAGVESLFLGAWLGAGVIKITALFFAMIWGIETVFSWKGLKWNLAVAAIFLAIALRFTRGPSLIMEIGFVDNFLILPFVSVWIPTLWGVSLWKKGAGDGHEKK